MLKFFINANTIWTSSIKKNQQIDQLDQHHEDIEHLIGSSIEGEEEQATMTTILYHFHS